jgi:hypothetical protein
VSQRFIQQRATQLDALDKRIIARVDSTGEISAAKLRKFDDLATLPKSTFYARLKSLAKGGFFDIAYERRMVVRSAPRGQSRCATVLHNEKR